MTSPPGRLVPARVYWVRQDKSEFTMTVADLANTGLKEKDVIDHALKALSAGGKVKIAIPHRIYQVYGRQLSIEGKLAAARRSQCSISTGGSIRSRPNYFPAGTTSTSSASSNRWCSSAAAGFDDPRCMRPAQDR
jgi:hypothetical protein